MPEEHKNNEYWLKRRKNNEAARRSREKRKMNDELLERKVMILTEENKQLRSQLLAIKMKYGEMNDLCEPLTSSVSLPQDFYDSINYDADSPENVTEMPSLLSHTTDLMTSRPVSRIFTSKVFTNASGDTSATVHVNKLSGPHQIPSSKFSFSDFPRISGSNHDERANLMRDVESRRNVITNFDFLERISRTDARIQRDVSPTNVMDLRKNCDDEPTFRTSSHLRDTSQKENEEAIVLARKFNSEMLKTLNLNQQIPLSNFVSLAKETINKLNYTLPHSSQNLASLKDFTKSGSYYTSSDEFIQKLRSMDKYAEMHEYSELWNNKIDQEDPEIISESSEISERPDSHHEDTELNETKEKDTVPGAKRKLSDALSIDESYHDAITNENSVLDDVRRSPIYDAPKQSNVQLPHKLRLKKPKL